MLDQLQTRRQILFDFTANYLDPLDGMFSRLAYLASLRDISSSKYTHQRLATVYNVDQIDDVISHCHEEVLERLLEMPLSSQEKDLRNYVGSLAGCFEENARNCKIAGAAWVPCSAPIYLRELFCSNLNVLTQILLDSSSKDRSGT